MEGAAAAGETKAMKGGMRIFAVVAVLALSIGMAAPAQAWPGGRRCAASRGLVERRRHPGHALRPGQARVSRTELKRDGSCSIDPLGNPICPAPRPTFQVDGWCGIDPLGKPACHPGS